VCRFHAGTADNIIPARAELGGTVRSFAPEVTERVLERLHEVCRGTAAAFGVEIRVGVRAGYPVLVNDPTCAAAVERVAARVVGADNVSATALPMAGGEDFAYMARATRGAYFFVGAGDDDPSVPVCHHPDFDFDDTIIPTAMSMLLGLVADRFARP
jgi:metal-dependent amidase/aminoacylase/carboxypeptidase family protein